MKPDLAGLLCARLGDPRAQVLMGRSRLSYAEIGGRAGAYAARLRRAGIQPGERIAVMARSSIELVVANLGHYLAGVIHVPINTRYRGGEVEHILRDCGPVRVLVDEHSRSQLDQVDGAVVPERLAIEELAEEAEPGAADDWVLTDEQTALLIYTSGTTGASKGVALELGAVLANMDALTRLWQWSEKDRLSLMLPLFHVHGLAIGIHGGLLRGIDILLHDSFDPAALVADIRERGATIFMGVPTMYRRLIEHCEQDRGAASELARARLFTSGSAALAASDFARFRQLTGHTIVERYGMSETLITLSNPPDGDRRPGSVGLPVPGCQIRVVGDDGGAAEPGHTGELHVRSTGMMRCYWSQPEATAAEFTGDGWFRTGDVVTTDPDGYVRIVGRKSVDIIKSGGFKISAREIEEVLAQHPDVREVAVFGVPDATWGQLIWVAVVPSRTGIEPAALLSALATYGSERLADYKKPRHILVLEELPRNALGKLQKHRLTELAISD